MRIGYWKFGFGVCLFFGIWLLVILIAGCAGPSATTNKVGDVTFAVSIQPDPPRVGDNTLKIKLTDAGGKVMNAEMVHITYTMPAMGGMPAMRSESHANLAGDEYQTTLSLSMLGTWDLRVEAHIQGKPHLAADYKITTGTKGITYVSGSSAAKGEIDLSKETNVVKLSPDEEKMVGVRTEPAARRKLAKEIRTVGIVAYDPDLYVAQEEFIGALKLNDTGLAEASKKRLQILGMSEEQIAELEKSGKPQSNLLLPEGKVWVYANFYEYEAAWLKEGAGAAVRATVDPAEEYSGKISALEPIVKNETRTIQAKIEVDNPKLALKPNMYVDVYLRAELPAALAVPSEAVLDTGIRKLVYVDKGDGIYVGREVKIGPEASGYIPILAGISPGDKVVSKANFLIDSQSKLTGGASALYGGAAKEVHQH